MSKAFIVCGAPASGKTSYARRLAESERAVFIDIDTATEKLVQLALRLSGKDPSDRDSAYFKKNFRGPVYEQLFDIAHENLPMSSVVIVGPFTKEIQHPDWPAILESRLDSKVEVHYVFCRPEVRRQRMIARGNPRDRAKLESWSEYIKYYADDLAPCFEHVLIDNSGNQGD